MIRNGESFELELEQQQKRLIELVKKFRVVQNYAELSTAREIQKIIDECYRFINNPETGMEKEWFPDTIKNIKNKIDGLESN